MATGFLPAGADVALDALAAAYSWFTLHVGDPGAAGTSNAATETTRKQITWADTGVDGATESTNELQWTNVAGTEDYTHCTLRSASTAGTVGASGTVTANPVSAGDTFTIAAGDVDMSVTLAS